MHVVAAPAPYVAPRWLAGGHAQTIYAALFAKRLPVSYRRVRWETPDGDFIDLDWIDGPPRAPLLILFHGLEGSSRSHYATSLMHAVQARGWRGVVPHFRGCSGEQNRLPRAYHSGDWHEIHWVLERMARENADVPRFAAGVSLGGNALLKWLAQEGTGAQRLIDAAAAVSAPIDLKAAGDELGRGLNLLYTRHFLVTLKRKSLDKLTQFPQLYAADRVQRARTLREFDNIVTAPLHGFADTDDYWSRASTRRELQHIALPTLLLNARNDPFLPGRFLPLIHEVSKQVHCEFPAQGGHVGFVSGRFPGRLDWLPRRLLHWFAQHVPAHLHEPRAVQANAL